MARQLVLINISELLSPLTTCNETCVEGPGRNLYNPMRAKLSSNKRRQPFLVTFKSLGAVKSKRNKMRQI